MPHISGHRVGEQTEVDTSTFTPEQQTAFDKAAALAPQGSITSTGTAITSQDLQPLPPPKIVQPEPVQIPRVAELSTAPTPTKDFESQIGALESAVSEVGAIDRTGGFQQATEIQQQRIIEIDKQVGQLRVRSEGALAEAEKSEVLDPFARGAARRAQQVIVLQSMNLNIEKSALIGEIQLARQIAQEKVEATFAQKQSELNAARANIQANFSQFNPEEKRRATALLLQLDSESKFIQQQMQEQHEIENIVIQGIQNGLTPEDAERARQSGSRTTATQIITEALGVPEAQVDRADFTLGKEQVRFDSEGNVIARGPSTAPGGDIDAPPVKGISPVTGKAFTTTQSQAGTFAVRIEQADDFFSDPNLRVFSSTIGFFIPGRFKSDPRKEFEQAEKNLLTAILRRESGAAISKDEFDDARIVYIPQIGDAETVLREKAEARQTVFRGLVDESVGAFDQLKSSLGTEGGSTFTSASGKRFQLPN